VSVAMAGRKIKLDEEAISEILVADTDSGSGSEASDFENYFEEGEGEGRGGVEGGGGEEEDRRRWWQQQEQASAEIKTG